jgi:hypothetical protein
VHAHIEGNRALVNERLRQALAALGDGPPLTAFEVVPRIHGAELSPLNAQWLLTETLALLVHLEAGGRARRIAGEPERWTATAR